VLQLICFGVHAWRANAAVFSFLCNFFLGILLIYSMFIQNERLKWSYSFY
jgi:hypothetical protein